MLGINFRRNENERTYSLNKVETLIWHFRHWMLAQCAMCLCWYVCVCVKVKSFLLWGEVSLFCDGNQLVAAMATATSPPPTRTPTSPAAYLVSIKHDGWRTDGHKRIYFVSRKLSAHMKKCGCWIVASISLHWIRRFGVCAIVPVSVSVYACVCVCCLRCYMCACFISIIYGTF